MAAGFPTKANFATGEVLTATQMNDLAGTVNILSPAAKGSLKAGSAANTVVDLAVGTNGQVLVADSTAAAGVKWGASSASFTSATNYVATAQTTTSTTYTGLTTAQAVTLTTGTKALVILTYGGNITSPDPARLTVAGYAVSGATTIAATDQQSLQFNGFNYTGGGLSGLASMAYLQTGLTAGSNTFTMQFKVSGNATGSFEKRTITVIDMGS